MCLAFLINVPMAINLPAWLVVRALQRRGKRAAFSDGESDRTTTTTMSDASSAPDDGAPLGLTRSTVWRCGVLCVCMIASASAWNSSIPLTSLSANGAIYQTSPLFAYLLSICVLGERASITRLAAVADRLPDRLAGPGGALAERPGVRSLLPLATAR